MKKTLSCLALIALLVSGGAGFAAERSRTKAAAPPALRMEDLEVRGYKEKPEVLYAPVHKGTEPPSPIRYDLFLVDMNRAVSPLETAPQPPPGGGTIPRSAP